MAWVFNDPSAFADDMIDGFVAASRRWVSRAPGGVIRSHRSAQAQVAVVIGGGSGHYPAFAGLVGPGLAHAAVMGNVFASPSARQVYDVARAIERGRGILLTYGNYAGDALNFDQGQDRLRAEGLDVRTVRVCDDIASAPVEESERRRGIAGDLPVFKIAGAAADRGLDLDAVSTLAQRAADRTRSLGVAFTGCTLPGAEAPLFTVAEGRMAIGLGIHGEPGIEEVGLPSADELAELLVSRLLAEAPTENGAPEAQKRVVPILNGLGAVKYEELYVVYRRVAELLDDAGVEVVSPEVGEFCTSFDMAGLSLTLLWLDDELADLWSDPVDTPAYRRGVVPGDFEQVADVDPSEAAEIPPAEPASQQAAGLISDVLQSVRTVIDDHADELGRIDAVAGDGDHGIGMHRGARAAAEAAASSAGAGAGAYTVLVRAADAWSGRAGGTSGVLWGLALQNIADQLSDDAAPTATQIADGVQGASQAIRDFGHAEVGDATMVDALVPFATTLSQQVQDGRPLAQAWADAAAAAQQGADSTAELVPAMGRARTHAEKSVGTPDAGAVSLALIVQTVGQVLQERKADE